MELRILTKGGDYGIGYVVLVATTIEEGYDIFSPCKYQSMSLTTRKHHRLLDYEIIKSFIPEEKRKHFLVFEYVHIYEFEDGSKIVAPYRAPFEEDLSIDLSDYEIRLKQKQREEKLNQLVP